MNEYWFGDVRIGDDDTPEGVKIQDCDMVEVRVLEEDTGCEERIEDVEFA